MADSEMDDIRRQKFIVTHLREIWNAINYGGVDIRGYMHWSFIDNFEWAEGFTARFGFKFSPPREVPQKTYFS